MESIAQRKIVAPVGCTLRERGILSVREILFSIWEKGSTMIRASRIVQINIEAFALK